MSSDSADPGQQARPSPNLATYLQLKRALFLRRTNLKISLRKLAEQIGVHSNTLWAWENGHAEPPAPMLFRWAALLRIDIDFTSQKPVMPEVRLPSAHRFRISRRLQRLADQVAARRALPGTVSNIRCHNDNDPAIAARHPFRPAAAE